MKNYSIYTTLFATALLCAACNNNNKELKESSKAEYCLDEKTKNIVEFITATKQPVTTGIHLTGSIEANPDKEVHFVSLVEGIIAHTYFAVGDAVTKGQVLAEMQSPELASLQAALSSYSAQIEIAKVNLAAKQQMFKDGISSNKELAEARNELRILQAEKQKVQANLSLFSASSTKNVFQIKAPASGIITAKNINSGFTVTNQTGPLFSIANLNDVWAMANIYATDIAHVKNAMEVEIKTISYPNEVFKGKIDVIGQVLDQETKVLKARIVLNNKDFKLKPGMLADILVLKKTDQKEIAVPTASIVFFNNKNYALVYKDNCNIQAREITSLSQTGDITYIKNGVAENEKIISKNQLLIFEALNN